MNPYTPNKAIRRYWKKRIEAIMVSPGRERELQQELLALLAPKDANTAIIVFRARREILLSSNHGQGLSWAPHSGFLWGFIKLLIGLFVKISSTGSLLRQILQSEEPIIKTIPTTSEETTSDKVLSKNSDQPDKVVSYEELLSENKYKPIEDELFEELIYEKPTEAFQNINSHIKHLIQQSTDSVEEINIVLDRLYALRLRLEPIDYFNELKTISQHAPAQTLFFLYQHYNKHDEMLNEHEFLELHLMAQTLMEHCVRSNETIQQHFYNIHYLLILMNAAPIKGSTSSPIDELISSIALPGQSFNKAINQVYEANRELIIENLKKKIPEDPLWKLKRTQIIQSFADFPINILKAQFKYENTTPISPLTYYFSRLAMEQTLIDHFDNPYSTLWNSFGLDQAGQGSATLQLLSENLLGTWENQALTTHTTASAATNFLRINPRDMLIFSSFGDIEQYLIAPLILSLDHGGINSARTTLLSKLNRAPLTSNQIEWIINRVQYYYPNTEIPQQVRDIFLFHEDWIKPLNQILEGVNQDTVEAAQTKINQNMTCLYQGSKKLCEEEYSILVHHLIKNPNFTASNDPTLKMFRQILEYHRRQDTRIFTTAATERTPLLANSLYSTRHTSRSQLAALNAANETEAANAMHDIGNSKTFNG